MAPEADEVAPASDQLSPVAVAIGQRLKAARTERRMSQEELARQAGVSRPAYGMWEAGRVLPDISRLLGLAEFLNLRPEYLAFGIGGNEDADRGGWIDEAPNDAKGKRKLSRWALPGPLIQALNCPPGALTIHETPRALPGTGVGRGDWLLVDTSQRQVIEAGHYAFWNGDRLQVGFVSAIRPEAEAESIVVVVGEATHQMHASNLRVEGRIVRAFVQVE
jgi:transcriptional regulator with XRE-family HTH domain